jgi:hypothetical protein
VIEGGAARSSGAPTLFSTSEVVLFISSVPSSNSRPVFWIGVSPARSVQRRFEHQADVAAQWEPYDDADNKLINDAMTRQGPDGATSLSGQYFL